MDCLRKEAAEMRHVGVVTKLACVLPGKAEPVNPDGYFWIEPGCEDGMKGIYLRGAWYRHFYPLFPSEKC
jgi:hypothetical protein